MLGFKSTTQQPVYNCTFAVGPFHSDSVNIPVKLKLPPPPPELIRS